MAEGDGVGQAGDVFGTRIEILDIRKIVLAWSCWWIQIVSVRLITEPFLRAAAKAYPQAASWIGAFIDITRAATWKNLLDVRRQYPHADAVPVGSKRRVIVFNVAGNKYRLISAIHFNTQIVFTLQFLTHAEYSKESWKNEL